MAFNGFQRVLFLFLNVLFTFYRTCNMCLRGSWWQFRLNSSLFIPKYFAQYAERRCDFVVEVPCTLVVNPCRSAGEKNKQTRCYPSCL